MRRALIFFALVVAVPTYAQAPVSVIAKIFDQKTGGTFDVVLLKSTPRTESLVITEGNPALFNDAALSRESKGLNGVLWLISLSPNLVDELRKSGLDETQRITLGDDNQLQIHYGTTTSLVVDFETSALVRVDMERDHHMWTIIWDAPGSQKGIRVLRDSAPFAMISEP